MADVPYLFLDFRKCADETHGLPPLREQMAGLRRVLGPRLLPDCPANQDGLEPFVELAFPHGLPVACFASNTSLKDGFVDITIRPKTDGPRLQAALPPGLSLALRGHTQPAGAPNPVFVVDRISWIADTPALPFEKEVTAVALTREESVYTLNRPQNGLLSPAFIAELPEISRETRKRLQEWRAYLDWKEKLVKARLQGARYVSVEVTAEGLVRFLMVAENAEALEKARRCFRSEELKAFELAQSLDPWSFEYNEEEWSQGASLGYMRRVDEAKVPPLPAGEEGPSWSAPIARAAYFELAEEMQNEYEARREADEAAAREWAAGRFPAQGFLALCIVGDLSLIRRQRAELDRLEKSGHAPFLTYYLFDASKSCPPAGAPGIDRWLQSSLNDAQKEAVRKMMASVDISYLQGPPGTGKSTVIGETAYQFVRRGKKVFVSSQANLAVDNALEKLVRDPEIRAVRLGKVSRIDKELPFTEQNALGTYYAAIRSACREAALGPWEAAEKRVLERTRWIEKADVVAADLRQALEARAELRRRRCAAGARRNEESASLEAARELVKAGESLKRFLSLLDGGADGEFLLPEDVLDRFHERIAPALDELRSHGIELNPSWKAKRGESAGVRSALARDMVVRVRRFAREDLVRVDADLARLRESAGDSVLEAAAASELDLVRGRRRDVEERMRDDGALYPEWQALAKRERELKQKGSGLDASFYSALFNAGGGEAQAGVLLARPDLRRADAVRILGGVAAASAKALASIEAGLADVREQAEAALGRLPKEPPDEKALQRAEAELRGFDHGIREASDRVEELRRTLVETVRERAEAESFPEPLSADRHPEFRRIAEEALAADRTLLERQREFRAAWEGLLREWTELLADPAVLANDKFHFHGDFVRACNVVGATCNEKRRTLEDAGHAFFDVAIVDEVSKATPPELVLPMTLARTTILVGDHRQLPPLFRERGGSFEEAVHEAQEEGEIGSTGTELTPENMERFRKLVTSGMFKENFEKAPAAVKAMLFVQYRMPPQVMDVVNHFYEGRLQLPEPGSVPPAADPRNHLHGLTLPGTDGRPWIDPSRQALWVDTSVDPAGSYFEEQRVEGSTSTFNDLEAVLIAKILEDLNAACRAQGFRPDRPKKVGVISFYGLQIRHIWAAIRERHSRAGRKGYDAIQVDVNTVDRFQGKERPIVLVSVVRNKKDARAHARAHIAQFERINVAFSRAQELLVVLGAKDMLHRYPVRLPNMDREGWTERFVYREILDYLLRNGCFIDCGKIMDAAAWRTWKPAERGKKPG
jgi:hypothetical protein